MKKMKLKKNKEHFFVGIKGSGVAALALMMKDLGYKVSGSDVENYVFTQERLIDKGVTIKPFNKNNIKDEMVVIVGLSFDESHEEVIAARSNESVEVYYYNEFLGLLMNEFHAISVAGTHGKTTTTALIAAMLTHNMDAGYLIGDGNGQISPNSKHLVVESCEFKRHFLAYHPNITIITSADIDHVDYYKDQADYISAYDQFINQTTEFAIIFGDNENARKINVDNIDHLYYGELAHNDVRAYNIEETQTNISFDVSYYDKELGRFSFDFVGRYMVWNTLAAIALGMHLGMDLEEIKSGLDSYQGADRRFQVDSVNGSYLVNDYAHHPVEMSYTIDTAHRRYPDLPVVAVMLPHRFTRFIHFHDEFAQALNKADYTAITPLEEIEPEVAHLDPDEYIDDLLDKVDHSFKIEDDYKSAKKLLELSPAVYLFMSSRDAYRYSYKLKELLEKE